MKRKIVEFAGEFAVAIGNARSQAATMVLKPGEAEGGPDNRHGGADQWLFVVSGEGQAEVAGETFALSEHSLLLVERGEAHGFRNTGKSELRILTFYVPPAYNKDGDELPAGLA